MRSRDISPIPADRSTSTDRAITMVAHWVMSGGRTLNKPSHFETRDGKF